jgi:nitroimidazol reductase NimA-like FMN-containing flavoprotein (pyridoxamine 5'-phosphate oxidase superfamily)
MDEITRAYRARPEPGEIAEVLAQRVTATLGTLNEDGSVHLAYVAFLHDGDRFFFNTASVTRKAGNAERRGWASILVQGRASSGRHLMVSAEGRARILRDAEGKAVNHRVRAKYARPEVIVDLNRAWDRLDDIAVEVVPTRLRAWTSQILREFTAHQVNRPYRDIWLPEAE